LLPANSLHESQITSFFNSLSYFILYYPLISRSIAAVSSPLNHIAAE
jgi:hypothetical protein